MYKKYVFNVNFAGTLIQFGNNAYPSPTVGFQGGRIVVIHKLLGRLTQSGYTNCKRVVAVTAVYFCTNSCR